MSEIYLFLSIFQSLHALFSPSFQGVTFENSTNDRNFTTYTYGIHINPWNSPDPTQIKGDGYGTTGTYLNSGNNSLFSVSRVSFFGHADCETSIRSGYWLITSCCLGFSSLQLAIDQAIIAVHGGVSTQLDIEVKDFKVKPSQLWQKYHLVLSVYKVMGPIFIIVALFASNFRYLSVSFLYLFSFSIYSLFGFFLLFFLGLCFFFFTISFSRFLADAVSERESKLTEIMRIMGLRAAVDKFAWWTTMMMVTTIPTLIFVGILKGVVYHYSDSGPIYLLVFSELFSMFSLVSLVRYLSFLVV